MQVRFRVVTGGNLFLSDLRILLVFFCTRVYYEGPNERNLSSLRAYKLAFFLHTALLSFDVNYAALKRLLPRIPCNSASPLLSPPPQTHTSQERC